MANGFRIKNDLQVAGTINAGGSITGVTEPSQDNSAKLSSTAWVRTHVAGIVGSAPATLDTLNELAAALGNDPNFATTVANNIAGKQNQLNGTGFVRISGTTISYDNSTYLTSINFIQVVNALGFTPYNATNPSGYISGISSAMVTAALGFTPYNASNPAGYITGISFANVSAKPTTLSGYGITDAVPSSRTISINGTTLDLSANRSFTITASETDTLATVTARGNTTSNGLIATASEGREVGTFLPGSYTTDDLVSGHYYKWYSDIWRLGTTRSGGAAAADFVLQFNGSRRLSITTAGAATFSSSVTVAGNIFTTNDSIFNTAGSITRHSVVGLVLKGVTASVFDLALYSANGTALIQNPTGTTNIGFSGGQVLFTGGNVGIGTTSPIEKLEIISSGAYNTIYSGANGNGASGLAFSTDNRANTWFIGSRKDAFGGATGTDRFNLLYGINAILTATPNGNVGIGTTSPTEKLVVLSSGAGVSAARFTDGNRADIVLSFPSFGVASIDSYLGTGDGALAFRTATNERMRITSNGNVGIGTTNVVDKLFVNSGNIRFSNSGASDCRLRWDFDGVNADSFKIERLAKNSIVDAFRLLTIENNGNVGIGTTSPVNNVNRNTLALQGAWGGQLDIMVGSVVHAQFGTDNFFSGLSARIQSQDGIIFRVNGDTEAFRISSNSAATFSSTIAASNISTGINANHIVQRDGNGYIYANHINFNTSETENSTVNSFITSNGDGWSRKASLQHVKNSIRGVADGTWGINITGNATTANRVVKADEGNLNTAFTNTPAGQLSWTEGVNQTNAPSSNVYYNTISMRHGNANNVYGNQLSIRWIDSEPHAYLRVVNNGSFGAWRTILTDFNYNSYSPTLTGGGASGTWGINITGYANNAFNSDYANNSGYSNSSNYSNTSGDSNTVGGYSVSVAGNPNTIPTRNGSGYLIPENWIQLNGFFGLYSAANNAHFRPNPNTFGSWLVTGSRNGWRGFEFDSGTNGNVSLMISDNSNTVGFHNGWYGWQMYWEGGTGYIAKNSFGGGTTAVILDSSNYINYISSGGGTADGVNINYNDWSAGPYQILYGNGTSIYGSPTLTIEPGSGILSGTRFNTNYSFDMWTSTSASLRNNIVFNGGNYGSGLYLTKNFYVDPSNFQNVITYITSDEYRMGITNSWGGTSSMFFNTWNLMFESNNSWNGYSYGSMGTNGVNFYTQTRNANFSTSDFSINDSNNSERIYWASWNSGDLYISGVLYQNQGSDIKLKTNVVDISNALEKIKLIRGVEFDWNELSEQHTGKTGRDVGVIAQEIQAVYPLAVREYHKEYEDHVFSYLTVDYDKLNPLAIQAIKELSDVVDALKLEIEYLKTK